MPRLVRFACAVLFVALTTLPAVAASDDGIARFLTQSAYDWNHGHLDAFMRGYEDAPTTLYISSKAVIHGYAAIRAHYSAHYGTSHMGTLSFSDLSTRMLGQNYAIVVARWHLAMTNGTHPAGLFSLVLHRSPTGWHIVDDHTP